uniref:Ubiquitin-like domain-containing protein n=1 Tax=Panagrellus redivivus TaxID=6233 RepID=A0A7E4VYY3_PANRE
MPSPPCNMLSLLSTMTRFKSKLLPSTEPKLSDLPICDRNITSVRQTEASPHKSTINCVTPFGETPWANIRFVSGRRLNETDLVKLEKLTVMAKKIQDHYNEQYIFLKLYDQYLQLDDDANLNGLCFKAPKDVVKMQKGMLKEERKLIWEFKKAKNKLGKKDYWANFGRKQRPQHELEIEYEKLINEFVKVVEDHTIQNELAAFMAVAFAFRCDDFFDTDEESDEEFELLI